MNDIARQCRLLAAAFRSQAARMAQPFLGYDEDEMDLEQLADHIERGTTVGLNFLEGFRATAEADGETFEQALGKFFRLSPEAIQLDGALP